MNCVPCWKMKKRLGSTHGFRPVNGGGDATKDGGVVVLQKEMRLV